VTVCRIRLLGRAMTETGNLRDERRTGTNEGIASARAKLRAILGGRSVNAGGRKKKFETRKSEENQNEKIKSKKGG